MLRRLDDVENTSLQFIWGSPFDFHFYPCYCWSFHRFNIRELERPHTVDTQWRANGNNNIANLVLPASGTQTVNLTGGTFTVNQLNLTGSAGGALTVANGTLIFDGTTPTFRNQSTRPESRRPLPQTCNSTTTGRKFWPFGRNIYSC